jgi:membrane protease YdiL (CAAX protease family)
LVSNPPQQNPDPSSGPAETSPQGADLTFARGFWIAAIGFLAYIVCAQIGFSIRGKVAADPWNFALCIAAALPLAVLIGVMRYGGGRSTTQLLGLHRFPVGATLSAALLGAALSLPLAELENCVRALFPYPKELAAAVSAEPRSLLGEAVALAIVAPLARELLYRGLLCRAFATRYGAWRGVVFAATIAALVEFLRTQAHSFIHFDLLFGLAAGWLVVRSDSLLPALVAALACFGLPFVLDGAGIHIAGYNSGLEVIEHVPWDLLGPSLLGVAVGVGMMMLATRKTPRP